MGFDDGLGQEGYVLSHFPLPQNRSPSLLFVGFIINIFLFELIFLSPGCMSRLAERPPHYSVLL